MQESLFHQIAVPLADSDDARNTARALNPYLDQISHLTLMYVVEKAGGAPDKASVEQREDFAEEIFDTFEVTLDEGDVERTILYGSDVAEAIQDRAAEIDATAIVLTSREGSRWVRFITGNVAERLRETTDRPVVILPRPEQATSDA